MTLNLSRREDAILDKLAASTEPVPEADLATVIAPFKIRGNGRPLKVVLHYLRKRLKDHGVIIRCFKGVGFSLPPESRAALAKARSTP